ncbi:MAG: dihydrofolate reductase [Gammaproteobacteria bacterium]
MTRDRIIGVDGRLPWHYREDMRRFKLRTMGCAVIMGRVTWDSLARKPLPGRRNIVLSRRAVAGAEQYDDIGAAVTACAGGDFWVIGGAEVYRGAMEWVDLLDVTTVPDLVESDPSFPHAVNVPSKPGVFSLMLSSTVQNVVRFPKIDLSCWKIVEKQKLQGKAGLGNVVYRRIKK